MLDHDPDTTVHQSLLVDGRILLVGDVCYCQRALDDDVLPPFGTDLDRQRSGFARLRQLQAQGRLVFSHETDRWAELASAPPP